MNFNFFEYNWLPSLKFFRPPLLYDLMNSMVNFGNDTQYSIHELSKQASSKIFNFEYPLSSAINKEEFEENILNYFINRRIGYETFTLFQIKLKTKMNEIMPTYNKLFDAIENWNIFQDGEQFQKTSTDTRTSNQNTTSTQNTNIDKTNTTNRTSSSNNTLNNTADTNNTSDRRFSDMPENQIQNVQNGTYLTNYNYDTNTAHDTSTSNGSSEGEENQKTTSAETNSMRNSGETNLQDNNQYEETSYRDVNNKIDVFAKYLENKNNIMTMIYKDLEVLFYQVID